MALRPQNIPSPTTPLDERKAAQDDVFLREVDDALRADEMLGAFQRYGRPAIALIVAGLIAFAGYLWWDGHSKSVAADQAEKFTIALDKLEAQRLDSGDKDLQELGSDATDGGAAAARILRAGIALEQNRRADALKLFADVSADSGAPQPFRDLATIREVATSFDTLPPATVVARMKPLAVPGNPWFGSAGELLGIAYLKQGRRDLAGPLFAAISRDKDAPESLRQRARQMAGLLGVDAIDDVDKAIDETSGKAPSLVQQ